MLSDGLSKRAAIMELSYAFESNQRLLEAGRQQGQKEAELEALQSASKITDQHVLIELVDCGVQADSLYLLTLMPLVHVAWANGYVTSEERAAVLKAAEQDGIRIDSPGFKVLERWLSKKPDASVPSGCLFHPNPSPFFKSPRWVVHGTSLKRLAVCSVSSKCRVQKKQPSKTCIWRFCDKNA
jgi:hypothetical protein